MFVVNKLSFCVAHGASTSLLEELNTVVLLAAVEMISDSATCWLLVPFSFTLSFPPLWSELLILSICFMEMTCFNTALSTFEPCGLTLLLMFSPRPTDCFSDFLEFTWQNLELLSESELFLEYPLSRSHCRRVSSSFWRKWDTLSTSFSLGPIKSRNSRENGHLGLG